ncbi:MAG: AMIN domain-containing protein, partial [Thermodesulfobacteriota bacterium]
NYTRIQIEGSESIPPPFYKLLSDPLRIAIDLPNADLGQIKETVKVNNGTVGEIQGTQYDDKGRIEISLLQMTNYNISKEERNILIDVEKVKKVVEVKEAKPEEAVAKEKKEEETKPLEPKKEETLPPPVVPPPPPPPMIKAKEIIDFQFEDQKEVTIFSILADGQIGNYNSFKLDSPPRLVLDIWEVETRYPKRSVKVKNPFIKEIRIGKHPDKLRLVFDSSKPQLPPYQINRKEDRLIVSMGNVPITLQPQISIGEKVSEAPPKTTEKPSVAQAVTPPKATAKPNTLKEINFKQMDNKSRVMVSLSEEPKFETHLISKNMIALDVKDSFAPKHLRRGLDTKEFDSAVSYISIQNLRVGKGNDLRILIKLKEEVPYETTQEGTTLFVDIEKPKRVEAKVEAPPKIVSEVKEVKKEEEIKKVEKEPTPEPKKEEKPPVPAIAPPSPQAPTGKKIEPERRKRLRRKSTLAENFLSILRMQILRTF